MAKLFYTLVRLNDRMVISSLEDEQQVNDILLELHSDGDDFHNYEIIPTTKQYKEDQTYLG